MHRALTARMVFMRSVGVMSPRNRTSLPTTIDRIVPGLAYYLDRKVVHFAYFYVLWMTVQFAVKAPVHGRRAGAAEVVTALSLSLIDPFGTLWFIYLLPVFFVVIKLTRRVPWPIIWLAGAALEILRPHTAGWCRTSSPRASSIATPATSPRATIFALAARAQDDRCSASPGLSPGAWSTARWSISASEQMPFISLALGLAGTSVPLADGLRR